MYIRCGSILKFCVAEYLYKNVHKALAGVAQWIEFQPVNQRVAGSIPSQGTRLGCRPGPQLGVCER